MATTPTNKPIPSEDPRDLKFNAGKIDEEVNGSADYYIDRFGAQRLTNTGRNNQFQAAQDDREEEFVASQEDKEARFQQFLLSSGYQFLGDYENGPYTINELNQVIRYQGELWRLNAATNAPYTTTGIDSTSWAVDVTHLVSVGDAALRQELASVNGASLIGGLGVVTPEMFRISSDPAGDWRLPIQRALDAIAAGTTGTRTLMMGGTYPVSLDSTSPGVTNAYSTGGVALSIKSAVNITGGGKVYLLAGQGAGREGAIFGNPHVTTISDVIFDAIEVDGNSANTSGKISGILMVGMIRPVVRSGVHVHDTTMHGIMMRPNASQSTGFGPVDVLYDNPQVENVVGIGLQATRPDGAMISGRVKNCGDNGWDVYGNQASDINGGYARRVKILDIQVTSALTGGFVESFPDAQVRGTYYDCNGVKLNRINSGAKRVDISATFSDLGYASSGTKYGINIGNNSGQAHIHGCTFENKKNSIVSGSGCTQVVLRSNNIHRGVVEYIWSVAPSSNSLVRCVIEDQLLDATSIDANGWPQLTNPVDHPWYSSSRFQSTVGLLKLIASNTVVQANFTKSTGVLTSPSAWGGAFSLYNVGGDGKTRINTDPDIDVSTFPLVVIAGSIYELSSSGTAGEYYVAAWTPTGVTFGNYTETLNSALSVQLKYEGFKTPAFSGKYYVDTRVLQSVSGWGGFSTYTGGNTLISFTGTGVADGSIAVINNYAYTLSASGIAGQYIAKRYTPSGAVSGDYTKYIAAAHTAYLQ